MLTWAGFLSTTAEPEFVLMHHFRTAAPLLRCKYKHVSLREPRMCLTSPLHDLRDSSLHISTH